MTIQHHTNGEVTINDRRVGWAETFLQATTRAFNNRGVRGAYGTVVDPRRAFVFWPMTDNQVRSEFVIVNELLYVDRDGRQVLNEAAVLAVVN